MGLDDLVNQLHLIRLFSFLLGQKAVKLELGVLLYVHSAGFFWLIKAYVMKFVGF